MYVFSINGCSLQRLFCQQACQEPCEAGSCKYATNCFHHFLFCPHLFCPYSGRNMCIHTVSQSGIKQPLSWPQWLFHSCPTDCVCTHVPAQVRTEKVGTEQKMLKAVCGIPTGSRLTRLIACLLKEESLQLACQEASEAAAWN